ncbi:hypothetical protein [Prescottella agglutinans]|uniref:hypothetical protein n=1 Tax=Prescottella agglutinans TaxID=1644129 RepID=UPI00314502AF
MLLALFAQVERTYTLKRAAHARQVAIAKGRRTGRPSVVTESQIAPTVQRDADATIAEITAKTRVTAGGNPGRDLQGPTTTFGQERADKGFVGLGEPLPDRSAGTHDGRTDGTGRPV